MSLNTIPFELDVQIFLRLLVAVVLGALAVVIDPHVHDPVAVLDNFFTYPIR